MSGRPGLVAGDAGSSRMRALRRQWLPLALNVSVYVVWLAVAGAALWGVVLFGFLIAVGSALLWTAPHPADRRRHYWMMVLAVLVLVVAYQLIEG